MSFDNDTYLKAQVDEILNRLKQTPKGGCTYIEFGGKAYDDQHSARVLPGYDANVKLRVLEHLSGTFEIVVVVSARDILRPRIRGDTQLFYDSETIRLVEKLATVGINVTHGVLSMVRDDYVGEDRERLEAFKAAAQSKLGMSFIEHGFVDGYPSPGIFNRPGLFARNPKLAASNDNLVVISPGGGSGKFGFCLSQLFHDFTAGRNSSFLKFETYPIHQYSADHPLNIAFVAATADLGNTLHQGPYGGLTEYDKDIENLLLVKRLIEKCCPTPQSHPLSGLTSSADMSVNKITSGIADHEATATAAVEEIRRRIERYKEEIERSIEKQATVDHLIRSIPIALQYILKDPPKS